MPADPYRFPELPFTIISEIGGVEKRPAACLLASWLLGGMALSRKEVSTNKGTVVVNAGHTWGSLNSAQDDIHARVGAHYTYAAMRNAASVLTSAGIITGRENALPQTRGKYGSIFALSSELATPTTKTIDVSAKFRHLFYGSPDEFRYAVAVEGDLATGRASRRTMDADAYTARVAEEGRDVPAFASIGRWRSGETMQQSAPVFLPWFVIDIDRENLLDAHLDTHEIALRIAETGFDTESALVSFSGGKGFHLQIGTNQFGSPIFADADAARLACDEMTARLCYGVEIDASVNNAKQLIRVTNSRHGRTGLYKVTWRLSDFVTLGFDEIMSLAAEPQPTPPVDPREIVEIEARIHDFYDEVSINTESRYTTVRNAYAANGTAGDVILRIVKGIEEGVSWSDRHAGRNKASFILACFLLEDRLTTDEQIDRQPDVRQKMLVWNERNTPPLDDGELFSTTHSARRRVTGR